MKRIIYTLLSMLAALIVVWLGGFDFDERGPGAVFAAILTALAFCFQFFAPWWE